MFSSPFSCIRLRLFIVVSICIGTIAMISVAAKRQTAAGPSSGGTERLAVPSAGGITPAASTIIVNSNSDGANGSDGFCTLREAITAANSNTASGGVAGECGAGGGASDTIDLSGLSGIITLATALPDINSDLSLNGPDANVLAVERSMAPGTPEFRILNISQSRTVGLFGLTLRNGNVQSSGFGGGILNAGSLTITKCFISNNVSAFGGAIFNSAGSLTVMKSRIVGNAATGGGGGIESSGGDSTVFVVMDSEISNNTSEGSGGGISIGTPTFPPAPAGVIANSTISNNSAKNSGGGILISGGPLNISSVTLTGNRSDSQGTGSSGSNGGGISRRFSGSTSLRNSIVALNFRGTGTVADDIPDALDASSSSNLVGTGGSGGLTNGSNNNQVGVADPKLGPLAANGGFTMTHALLTGSPAIDAGSNVIAANPRLTTDQRGFPRIIDGPDADSIATVDVGAYEKQLAFADIGDLSTNEDVTAIVAFELDDPGSVTSITATSSNTTLIPSSPANISTSLSSSVGSVTIIPAANLFGASDITVTVNRNSGGISRTFTLTVNSSNDAPSFIKGANQTVKEDSGPQTVNNWATEISAGPSNESGQTLSFIVVSNNTSLFSTQPTVSSNGTLTYSPAPDAAGTATVNVNLTDDGGMANDGHDSSPIQTFTITLAQVNDAPSFTKGADQTVNNNAGAETVTNWTTNISTGPANESFQTLTFQVTNNTNASLFSVLPAISSTGTLTYRPASNVGGTATITFVLRDNGGTANGGVDTSPSQSFNITVVPVGGSISFAAASTNTTESSGSVEVTVNRSGDTTRAVTVDYATSADNGLPCSNASGVAAPKCDFTTAFGTLNFAAGETSKTITVLISQDSLVEGPETLSVTLSNQTNNAALASPSTAFITIADDAIEPPANAIDEARNFVRQHYHDFLNREPDSDGWDFWTNRITACGSDVQCNEVRHIDVSASFFLSIEFQQSGYLVERFYKVAYGDAVGNSTFQFSHQLPVPIVRFSEFLKDTQRIGRGVIVLQPGWEQALDNNKQAYALEFVQTTRFMTAFPTTMTPAQLVDRLNQNGGGVLSLSERQAAIDLFGGAGNTTNQAARGQAVRTVAEDQDLYNVEFNRAFVLVEYFGYLRRNPNDPQDTDYTGYDFWLTKLNQFNGNYIDAEMVKAFLSSIEYRQRFGP